jgi:hypothetical protein
MQHTPYPPGADPSAAPSPAPTGFSCPFCQATSPPVRAQRISTGGWITFAVLLVVCFPLFWIGLLIKEDYTSCSACGIRLGA